MTVISDRRQQFRWWDHAGGVLQVQTSQRNSSFCLVVDKVAGTFHVPSAIFFVGRDDPQRVDVYRPASSSGRLGRWRLCRPGTPQRLVLACSFKDRAFVLASLVAAHGMCLLLSIRLGPSRYKSVTHSLPTSVARSDTLIAYQFGS